LVDWLRDNDCESVYCRQLQQKDVDAVPEFQKARADGLKDLGNESLALQWLPSFLDDSVRDGFFDLQQEAICETIRSTKAKVVSSVMTDSAASASSRLSSREAMSSSSILAMDIKGKAVGWNLAILVLTEKDLSKEKMSRFPSVKSGTGLSRLRHRQSCSYQAI